MSRAHTSAALLVLSLAASLPAGAQFKVVGPAPYSAAVAHQKIGALLTKVDPANRQQTIMTISDLLVWFRDVADDELIKAWKKDAGRENLPDVIKALADARVATEVVTFSWRERREATFQLANAPMFENLMLRFPDSAKPFLDDLLASTGSPASQPAGQPALDLSEAETYTVCRILLDMPDMRTWRQSALQILPHYRDAAETLLATDLNGFDRDKRVMAQYWSEAIRPSTTFATRGASPQRAAEGAQAGTLECTGDPIPPNGEITFPNVQTAKRRFEYDRKIWDVRLEPGKGDTKNFVLTNKSSSPQKRCVIRWTAIP